MNIQEIEQAVKEEIEERADELKESAYPEDLLFEIADSHIPVYYHNLTECLAYDPSLAYVDDPGLIDISKGVYQIIQVAIYERLILVAHEAYENLEPETPDLIQLVARICDPSGRSFGVTR